MIPCLFWFILGLINLSVALFPRTPSPYNWLFFFPVAICFVTAIINFVELLKTGGKMNKDESQSIGSLTVSELKALIKECLRELEEEKGFTETQYKQLWINHP